MEALAKTGNPSAIRFPRSFSGDGTFEFSFSGLKSAVINTLHTASQRNETLVAADVAASFQAAVVDILAEKALQAVQYCEVSSLVLSGGVAANGTLRLELDRRCRLAGVRLYSPDTLLCTDNAAMIGCRAYYQLQAGDIADLSLNAIPSLPLGGKP